MSQAPYAARSLALLLAAWSAPACVAEFTIARDGAAACVVLAPAEQGARLRTALDDFARYIERISGTRVPFRTPDVPIEGRDAIRFAVAEAPGVPFDGFRMDVRPDEIRVSAPREAGLVNAIYSLLQDDLGVRWYLPGDQFQVVPERPTLTVPDGVREGRPSFFWRVIGGNGTGDGANWLRRNRLDNGVPHIPDWGFGHNVQRIFPREAYAREHPEYYVFREGRWCIPGHQNWAIRQACFTNPEVARIGADYARRFFAEHPDTPQVSLSANDNNHYCECANCRELDEPRPVYEDFRIYSDSYFHWVKAVAEDIAATHPGRSLGALAYWNTVVPPRRIDRMPENVVIVMTQDTCQHVDPVYRDRDREITLEWTHRAQTVARYDYGCLTWFTPKYYPHVLADELRYLHQIGVGRYYIEADTHWANAGPGIFMAAQMLWDIEKDPDALLAEFFAALYGEAADEMAAYYDYLEQVWDTPRKGSWFQGFMNTLQEFEVWDLARIRRAEAFLEDARTAADNDDVRRRIDFVADGFRFSSLLVEAHATAHALRPQCFVTADGIADVIGVISAKIDEALRQADTAFTVENHYPQGEYRGDRFRDKTGQWIADIRDAVAASLAAWMDVGAATEAEARAAQVMARFSVERDPRVRDWLLTGLYAAPHVRGQLLELITDDPVFLGGVMEVRGGDDPRARTIAESLCTDLPASPAATASLRRCSELPGDIGRYASWELARRTEPVDAEAAVLGLGDFLASYPTGDTAPRAVLRLALLLDRSRGGTAGRRELDSALQRCDLEPSTRQTLQRLRRQAGLWSIYGPLPRSGSDLELVLNEEAKASPCEPSIGLLSTNSRSDPAWQIGPAPDGFGFFDLESVWGELDQQVGYAQTFLFSPEERDAVFWIGSDDGIVVWLDRERIHEVMENRAAVADEDRIPVRLRKGWNRVLLKILETEGGWGWFFRAGTPDDRPLQETFFAFGPDPET